MSEATKRIPVNTLILDYDLYPRSNMDAQNVSKMVDALEAGRKLPPILIDKKSRKVVDGFHRCKAALRFSGELAEIDAVERAFKSEDEMLVEAGRLNSPHGVGLDKHDKVHFALLCKKRGINEKKIADAINLTIERYRKLMADRTAKGSTANGKSKDVALKRTLRHLAGTEITEDQEEANKKLSGMDQVFYANQLLLMLRSKSINVENESLLERLGELRDELDSFLSAKRR